LKRSPQQEEEPDK